MRYAIAAGILECAAAEFRRRARAQRAPASASARLRDEADPRIAWLRAQETACRDAIKVLEAEG